MALSNPQIIQSGRRLQYLWCQCQHRSREMASPLSKCITSLLCSSRSLANVTYNIDFHASLPDNNHVISYVNNASLQEAQFELFGRIVKITPPIILVKRILWYKISFWQFTQSTPRHRLLLFCRTQGIQQCRKRSCSSISMLHSMQWRVLTNWKILRSTKSVNYPNIKGHSHWLAVRPQEFSIGQILLQAFTDRLIQYSWKCMILVRWDHLLNLLTHTLICSIY